MLPPSSSSPCRVQVQVGPRSPAHCWVHSQGCGTPGGCAPGEVPTARHRCAGEGCPVRGLQHICTWQQHVPNPTRCGDKPPVAIATSAGQKRSQPPGTLLLVPCPHPGAGGPICRAHLDPGWGSREPPFAAPRADTQLHTAQGSSRHPQPNSGKGAGSGGRSGQRGGREIKTRHGKHQETSVIARALRLLTKRTILFCPQHL